MKKLFNKCSFLLPLIFFSCAAQKNINLGTTFNEPARFKSKVLIPSGALIDVATHFQNNCLYTIGINKDKTIVYVSTIDSKFEVNGYKVFDEATKIFDDSKVKYVAGWGYYIQIDADWYAGFDYNLKPNKNSKIQWFFKYKFSEGNKNLFNE